MKSTAIKKTDTKSSKNTKKSARVRAWDVTSNLNVVLRKFYSEDQMLVLKPLIQSYSLDVVLLHDIKKKISADNLIEEQMTKYGSKEVISTQFRAYQELVKDIKGIVNEFTALFEFTEKGKNQKERKSLNQFLSDFDSKVEEQTKEDA